MKYADIEYSKKLKDLFPESEWWWREMYEDKIVLIAKEDLEKLRFECKELQYPALTTDSLLERLPIKIRSFDVLHIQRDSDGFWNVGYNFDNNCDKSLPNALCLMLIYLKDNGLLENK